MRPLLLRFFACSLSAVAASKLTNDEYRAEIFRLYRGQTLAHLTTSHVILSVGLQANRPVSITVYVDQICIFRLFGRTDRTEERLGIWFAAFGVGETAGEGSAFGILCIIYVCTCTIMCTLLIYIAANRAHYCRV